MEVVICYARKDQEFLLELKEHLSLLEREKRITLWADINIDAGSEWGQEIHHHLNTARVILLLISPSFIASDYSYDIEMQSALKRHEDGKACVIPIIVRPVADWKKAPFSKLQVLPKNAKPINTWTVPDEAYHNVVEGLVKVINKIEETNNKTLTQTSNDALSVITPKVPKRNRPIYKRKSFWAVIIGLIALLLVPSFIFLQSQLHPSIPFLSLQ